MPAPLAAAAIAPVVTPIAQSAVKVLSTDIVRLEGRFFRRLRVREPRRDKNGALTFTPKGRVRTHTVTQYEPINVTASLNPIGLGVLAVGAAIGAFMLFGRIHWGIPLIGEIDVYKGPLNDELEAWKGSHSPQCKELQAAYKAHLAHSEDQAAEAVKNTAAGLGCAWAT